MWSTQGDLGRRLVTVVAVLWPSRWMWCPPSTLPAGMPSLLAGKGNRLATSCLVARLLAKSTRSERVHKVFVQSLIMLEIRSFFF